ncbi:acetyl-CoA carboxylase biotin carboxyl carrier protein [Tenuibacillus multivorans]|uniref:Biotin carboxyl carrier protein of acetyl-CoA carboxylase n=1 Tax=Tenuibacillus multivorans TaxID=237069 RepID=A0A1G9Z9D5_9BACI|nr:acetyl-CoA carboxylase biotin carboxyl carrier protein [Tenuibacillus multivorans]GEL77368.1 acetyl-CoA carboxylase, biotin carboxyl carrier protein [Tenuibacillus multivorans]SDN17236.1 acetyl-CoA carboxylase biotin carboxyl carrier protein [Tenuibacillus multivorans]
MLKVQEIRELIKLIDESSISDFTYESNGTKVTLKKENGDVVTVAKPSPAQTQIQEVQEQAPNPTVEKQPVVKEEVKQETKEETTNENTDFNYEIVSPMVGTFYAKPTPDDDPYVQVGDSVDTSSVVCIVEAMKLFNEIEAEVKGKIVEILVDDGELVEYGQPLFRVKKQ